MREEFSTLNDSHTTSMPTYKTCDITIGYNKIAVEVIGLSESVKFPDTIDMGGNVLISCISIA